jgi:hypothetical protein
MIEQLLDWFTTSLTIDIGLKLAQIISSSVVAITLAYTINGYLKMRTTEQIKIAHDFFKDYRELEKESATLREQGKVRDERMDWASRYLNTIEWFSFLGRTNGLGIKILEYNRMVLVSCKYQTNSKS